MWLKLVSTDREVVVWATRRLIGALLGQAQTFLRGDQDEETWQTAHARAVAPFLDRGGDKPPAKSESIKDHARPVGLAYEVQLTRQNELNLFVFKTNQGQFGVPCSATESHCLLALLHRRSEAAKWGFRSES